MSKGVKRFVLIDIMYIKLYALFKKIFFLVIYFFLFYLYYVCSLNNKTIVYYGDSQFPKLEILKENFEIIQKECLDVYRNCEQTDKITRSYNEWNGNLDAVQEFVNKNNNKYWIPAWTGGWYNYPLMVKDVVSPGITTEICKNTTSILKSIGGINVAGFSLIKGGYSIDPHTDSTGPSFGTLAYHLCLIGKSTLVVNDIPTIQKPGKTILFNREYTHYLFNHTDEDRIILYMDFVM